MPEPTSSPSPPADAALTRALAGLVSTGALSAEQAEQVSTARAQEAARDALVEPSGAATARSEVPPTPAARDGAASRLPEVLGYLGGTFVVAAVLLVLGWSWESFSHATRVILTTLGALVLYGSGLAIALAAAGGRATLRLPEQAVRRRLVGVLLVVGSFLAAGAVGLLGEDSSRDVWLLPIALTAVLFTALAVRLAPGVVPTLGLFAATVMLAASPENLSRDLATLTWVLIFLALGLAWVAAGPWVTGTPTAALAVGLSDLVATGWVASEHSSYDATAFDGRAMEWGDHAVAPVGFTLLAVLAVLGVALYLRGQPWPWLAAATVSAAVLIFQVAGDAFGPAVAALVLGALLLTASGLLIVRRGRVDRLAATDPGP